MVLAVLILQILLWRKRTAPPVDLTPLHGRAEAIERAQERTERGLREEIGRNREEAARDSRDQRQEVQAALARLADTTDQKLESIRNDSASRFSSVL